MKELACCDVQNVSGGMLCVDGEDVKQLREGAQRDGMLLAGFVTPAAGVTAAALTRGGVQATVMTMAIVAPWCMIVGFVKSSVWRVLD